MQPVKFSELQPHLQERFYGFFIKYGSEFERTADGSYVTQFSAPVLVQQQTPRVQRPLRLQPRGRLFEQLDHLRFGDVVLFVKNRFSLHGLEDLTATASPQRLFAELQELLRYQETLSGLTSFELVAGYFARSSQRFVDFLMAVQKLPGFFAKELQIAMERDSARFNGAFTVLQHCMHVTGVQRADVYLNMVLAEAQQKLLINRFFDKTYAAFVLENVKEDATGDDMFQVIWEGIQRFGEKSKLKTPKPHILESLLSINTGLDAADFRKALESILMQYCAEVRRLTGLDQQGYLKLMQEVESTMNVLIQLAGDFINAYDQLNTITMLKRCPKEEAHAAASYISRKIQAVQKREDICALVEDMLGLTISKGYLDAFITSLVLVQGKKDM